MNDKIYKIFISSTYKDLKEYRQKVIDAILKMQFLPVGMEMFNASSDSQWKIITDTIDDSDYYVLILGKRYGSVMDRGSDKGMSYTEREFRYAMDRGVPCMGFLVHDEADIKASNMESDPEKLARLNAFRKLVEENGTVNYWKNSDELAGQVRSSLEAEIKKHPRNGWGRNISCGNKFGQMEGENDVVTNLDSDALMHEGIDISDEDVLQDYLLGRYERDENGWYYKKVPDGRHIRRALFQDIKLEEGTFKDDKLIEGVSYNWILRFWKVDADGDEDLDAPAPTIKELTEDTPHEDISWSIEMQYGGNVDFYSLEDYIEHEGIDKYYVADKKVYGNGKKIKLLNMRTLERFLVEHDPKELKYLQTGEIETEFDEEIEDLDFSGLLKEIDVKQEKSKAYTVIEVIIREADKTLSVKDISDACAMTPNTVKRIVSKLIEEGKVERVGSNKNGGFRWIG